MTGWREPVRLLLAGMLVMAVSPAHAWLGGGTDSIDADVSRLQATRSPASRVIRRADRAAPVASWTVQSLVLPSGIRVREYAAAGRVFGIAWDGPDIPDLPQLYGQYFPSYAHGVQASSAGRVGRGPVGVRLDDFVANASGRPLAYQGRALVPSLLPAGVSATDIQ